MVPMMALAVFFCGVDHVYRKLKKLAPQSEEVIEVRELIDAAVIKN